jgi:hypothetical protein
MSWSTLRAALAACVLLILTGAPTSAPAQPALDDEVLTLPRPAPPGAEPQGPFAIPGQSGPQVGPNLAVSSRADTPGLVQSETSIAVQGVKIAAGWNDSKGFFTAGVGVTGQGQSTADWDHFVDGGGLPQPPGLMLRGDPAIASCSGAFFFSSLALPSSGSGTLSLVVSRGDLVNGTIQWQTPVTAVSHPTQSLDKEYIACDPQSGTLFMSYTRFGSRGQIEIVRSTNLGATWSAPVVLQAEEATVVNQGSYPAVGPDGEVCVAWQRGWLDANPIDTIQLRCSTNGGVSFGPLRTAASFTSTPFTVPPGYNRARISDFPGIDIDRSDGPNRGTIYVAYQDGSVDIRDVRLVRSTNLGATWSAPVTINDDAGDGSHEFFPWVNVDPDGRVGVLWYTNAAGVTDVFLDISTGTGGADIRVTDTSTNWLATSADIQPNYGDYINLASSENHFHAAWADGRFGDPDVFYAAIRSSDVTGVSSRLADLPRTGPASVPSADPVAILEVFGQEADLGATPLSLVAQGNVVATLNGAPLTVTPGSVVFTSTGATHYYEIDLSPLCSLSGSHVVFVRVLDDQGAPLTTTSKLVSCTP